MALLTKKFGPFAGVVDRANPSLSLTGKLKKAKGLVLSGAGRLTIRGGTSLALTLKDDAASPANVTSVLAIVPFADGALAFAHSTNTNKAYVYRLKVEASGLTGWYDAAGTTLYTNTTPQPAGVLWSSITTAPDVSVAEGLGLAYIAHPEGADSATLTFPLRVFNQAPAALSVTSITRAGSTATLTAAANHNLRTGDLIVVAGAAQSEYNGQFAVTVTGATTLTYTVTGTPATPATGTITYKAPVTNQLGHDSNPMYALWAASFKNHLWVGGAGSGTTAADHYRPELSRFSAPSFGAFASSDSVTLGDRVRSQREKIVMGIPAGDALFLAGPFMLSRIMGYGRSSWVREQVDKTNGVVGPKAACAAGDYCYGWGARGPWRCAAGGQLEPLWDAITATVESVVNPSKIVAAYDEASDLVMFFYDAGSGVRTFCAFDIRREVWIGPDDDIGLAIRGAGSVSPVYGSTAAPSLAPAGPPTTASTTNVTTTSAKANWVAGDSAATTRVEYKRQADSAWTTAVTGLAAGVVSYTITGLTSGVAYEWRAAHVKNGFTSSYLGPSAATQFTTSASSLTAPSGLSLTSAPFLTSYQDITANWTNSGESGVSTEIYLAGPSASAPADADYVLKETVTEPVSTSSSGSMLVSTSGTYWVRIRHTKSGYTASSYATESIAVTV